MPRFMMLIQIDEDAMPEAGPSQELFDRMDVLIKDMTDSGAMLETAGLRPTKDGVRVTNAGARIRTYDGPFTEAKEIVGGYALIRAADRAEAVEWARRFVEVHADEMPVTTEIRQLDEE